MLSPVYPIPIPQPVSFRSQHKQQHDLSILLIEDMQGLAETMKKLLEHALQQRNKSARIVLAHSPKQALERYSNDFDLIIIDYSLTDKSEGDYRRMDDAPELAQQFEEAGFPHNRIYFMSGDHITHAAYPVLTKDQVYDWSGSQPNPFKAFLSKEFSIPIEPLSSGKRLPSPF